MKLMGWGMVLLATTAFAQQYHSNDLMPPVTTAAKLASASKGKQVGSGSNNHAYRLSGNALAATDLNPPGYSYSYATASDDTAECGYGWGLTGYKGLKWNGTGTTYSELSTPSNFNAGFCLGIDNGSQVGYAQNLIYSVTVEHGIYWDASGAPIDLHPGVAAYPYSRTVGIKSGEQVGYVSQIPYPYGDAIGVYHTTSHAYKWSGSAASGVDMHPAQFDASEITSTNGTQQGGWGYSAPGTSKLHALLWSGDAQSVVDLAPAGYTDTRVNALSATQQVGEGWVGSVRHALAWSGTADSVVDLNQYLPAGYTNAVATGIDADGNVVGFAYNGTYAAGTLYAVPPGAIAVVFAPGPAPAAGLSTISATPTQARPGDVIQVTVTLGAAAPAGGVNLTFLSTNTQIAATPASATIAEGQTTTTFPVQIQGSTLTASAIGKIYVTDGSTSLATSFSVTPVVKLTQILTNAVEGGFGTVGSVWLNIPAQTGGVSVALSSGNSALATVPASVTLAQGVTATSFQITTQPVTASTVVPITATFDGTTVTSNLTLSPAPVVALSSVSAPAIVGGQAFTGYVAMTNFPRNIEGATVSLTADSNIVQLPATVVVPKGAFSAPFSATASTVSSIKTVTITATYNGTTVTTTMDVNPIPTVTITAADYVLDTQMFKVKATTTYANSILTFGTDPKLGPIGSMQVESPGVWSGAVVMATAPRNATVWNSNGGSATVAVTVKTGTGGNSTGGGGGGGGSTNTYKLAISTNGKGSVALTCGGAACASPFAAGTVVTLTATPAAGSPWVGWSGACSGTATSCNLTMNKDQSVTANFR